MLKAILTALLCAVLSTAAYAVPETKHIGVFHFVYATVEPPIEERDATLVQSYAEVIKSYYKNFSSDKWDVQVRGYKVYTDCEPKAPYYCEGTVLDYIATHDMDGFVPNYYHIWGGHYRSYCGQAGLNQPWSVTYLNAGCGTRTMIHELGHSFGLHHAATLVADKYTEYGDATTVMGSSAYGTNGLLSWHYLFLGLDDSLNVIEDTQQVIVAPVEVSIKGLLPDDYKSHLLLVNDKIRYTISLRKRRGVPYRVLSEASSTLYIHEIDQTNRTIRLGNDLQPGRSMYLRWGITVDYLEYSNERAKVNVIFDGDPIVPQELTLSDEFPAVTGTITKAHSGVWHDALFPGQGLDVLVKGDRVVIFWYTYNATDHARRFYYGTCTINECVNGFILRTTTVGDITKIVGAAQLYFTAPDEGVLTYRTAEHGGGSIELTPAALGSQEPQGVWHDPDNPGSGFSVHRFGDTLAMYWFTNANVDSVGLYTVQTQRWYLAVGTESHLKIYEAKKGTWRWDKDVKLTAVGSASALIVGDNITFTYSLGSRSGTIDLIRLF